MGLCGEFFEEVDDFGAGPVLGSDELAADDAGLVDDVGFGVDEAAVEGVGACGAVADAEEVDLVGGHEVVVGVGVVVRADGDDVDLRELLLHRGERGELGDAGRAPGGPEDEDNYVAALFGEVDGLGAVADGESGRGPADLAGVVAAVAAGCAEGEQECGGYSFGGSMHLQAPDCFSFI